MIVVTAVDPPVDELARGRRAHFARLAPLRRSVPFAGGAVARSWRRLHTLAEADVAVYFAEEDILVPHEEDWRDRTGGEIKAAAA